MWIVSPTESCPAVMSNGSSNALPGRRNRGRFLTVASLISLLQSVIHLRRVSGGQARNLQPGRAPLRVAAKPQQDDAPQILPTAYCLLPTAYYLLHTDYCLLPQPIAGQVIQVGAPRATAVGARNAPKMCVGRKSLGYHANTKRTQTRRKAVDFKVLKSVLPQTGENEVRSAK